MTMDWRKWLSIALLGASVLVALGPGGARASVPRGGTLTADRDCEAFVSKKKKSNPDKAHLDPGDAYVILEVNRPEQPDWFRVRVEDANPPERWVEASCGHPTQDTGTEDNGQNEHPIDPNDPSLCSTAGLQDSYKLALSWQPAFCESHHGKKECAANFPTGFQAAGNFTLHGLWPNRDACGTHYGNCDHRREQREFCDYPAPSINADVAKQMSVVMPGTASCLERHEWYKHGTCQTDWDPSQYFETAMNLVRQFNDSGMNKFMAANMGKQVQVEDFLTQVDNALGPDARQRLQLTCAGGTLTDVFIALPAHIEPGSNLGELIRTAPPDFRSKCGSRFLVDPVGLSH